VSFTVLRANDAFWRPSNQMGVLNTDLAKQVRSDLFGARLWRLMPNQASTRHRHVTQHELYVVLVGTGRIRVEQELLTLDPLSAVLVEESSNVVDCRMRSFRRRPSRLSFRCRCL